MQSDCHVSVALHFTAWMLKLWSWQPRCSFLKKSSIASLIDSNSRNKDKQNQTPTNICAHVLLNPIRHFLYTKYWLTAAACFCLSLSGLVWNEAEKTASAKGASVIVEPDPKQNYGSYLVMVWQNKMSCQVLLLWTASAGPVCLWLLALWAASAGPVCLWLPARPVHLIP